MARRIYDQLLPGGDAEQERDLTASAVAAEEAVRQKRIEATADALVSYHDLSESGADLDGEEALALEAEKNRLGEALDDPDKEIALYIADRRIIERKLEERRDENG